MLAKTYLFQFIGGPFNSEQKYLDLEKRPEPGDLRLFMVDDELQFHHPLQLVYRIDSLASSTLQTAQYILMPLPERETPFSDFPIIVAIYRS